MEVKKGYKQTEVGVIPEDWDAIPIGNIFEFKNGLNKAKGYFGKGTPIVNYMDVFNNPGLLKRDVDGKVTLTADEIRNYQVKKGDVFFTRTSETVDEIGMSSVLLENITAAVFSGFVLRGRPKNDILDLLYKQYCFRSMEVRKQICSTSSYTTRALTNGKLLSNVYLPVPSTKAEQIAIAASLSDANVLIQSLEKLIAKKRNIKQGAMQELLKPKEGWVVKKLGTECELITKGTTPTSIGQEFQSSGVNFIKIESLGEHGHIIIEKIAFIDTATNNLLKRSQLKVNDLLISIAGALGRVAIVQRDMLPANTNQALAIARLKSEATLELEYVFHFIKSNRIQKHIEAISVQGAQANLSLENINDLPIDTPLIKTEQTRIASILSDMDAEISALETKFAKYKQIKQGMMQELLTGRIRLV